MSEQTNRIMIKIRYGHEHELFKNQNILDQQTLMYPAYHAALMALNGIIDSTQEWYGNKDHNNCKHPDMSMYGFANNVIAFCGNRGQGKTSSLISFTSALGFRNHGYQITDWDDDYEKQLKEITKGCSFFVLPPIDPTMLNDGDSAISLMLTNLFNEIENRWNAPSEKNLANSEIMSIEAKKYDILHTFRSCITGLHLEDTKETARRGTGFETFAQSNDVFALKHNIHTIIMHLFKLLGWGEKDSFLVVQLDDTDMQMDRAYETLEHVRKYLSIPNVVVVMGTDINQLRTLVNRHYRVKLASDPDLDFKFDYISAKYIDKLIPVPQTIHLPTLKSQWDLGRELRILVDRNNDTTDTDKVKVGEEIQAAIFELIYRKTGLVFIRHTSYMHEIIPSSLRGYMHLYRFLDRLEDPEGERKKASSLTEEQKELNRLEARLRNLSMFEEYFINEWVPSRLREKQHRDKICELKDVSIGSLFKYILINVLPRSIADKPEAEGRKPEDLYPSIYYNGVYATLLNALDKYIKQECLTSEEYNFAFAIGTYISIQMQKCSIVDECDDYRSIMSGNNNKSIQYDKLRLMLRASSQAPELTDLKYIKYALGSGREKIDTGILAQSLLGLLDKTETKSYLTKCDVNDVYKFQHSLVYLCCNWDVLHQIYDNVINYTNVDAQKKCSEFVKEVRTVLGNASVGIIGKNAIGRPEGMQAIFENLLRTANRERLPNKKGNAPKKENADAPVESRGETPSEGEQFGIEM